MIAKDRLVIQQQVYNFLRSVTIKYDPIAQYLNSTLIQQGYAVNEQDPTTWKYYLNMQGKYHTSDTKMYVTSLDTRETILFSPDVLEDHPRTKSVYMPGGLYYDRLCNTYPQQVDLIKSIVFPVPDIEKAIDADNLTLLSYGNGYLEEWEQQPMIMDIENFLEIVKERWYFDFLDDEPYFYLTFWGSLWTYLAMLIMSNRMEYINTPYVHSWHIWNYLKSKGLDDYSDVLDREKSMMLYQDIDYLKSNAGKQSNLIILANGLLNDFGVAIYGRKVVQEAETNADKYQLIPQLQAVRVPTSTEDITAEITSETVAAIQSAVFAKGLTDQNTAEAYAETERKLGDTTLNDFMTKFLEIRPIARNKVYADTLNVFLLETLITAVINDYYASPTIVTDTSTNVSLFLYPRELLALYHYAVQKSLGLTPVNIPNQVFLYKAFNTTIGTPAKTIKHGDETIYLSTQLDVDAYLSDLEYKTIIEYPADFSEMLTNLWLRFMDHLLTDQNTKIDKKHYILEYLTTLCHTRRIEDVDLVAGFTDYETWLGSSGIDLTYSVLPQYDAQLDPSAAWGNLADSIMSALVPLTDTLNYFGNFTLSDFGYTRLRQLFVQMCSYRVVFLESDRSTPESATGAKWSTWYGPDHVEMFADRCVTRLERTTDTTLESSPLTLDPGIIRHKTNNITDFLKYTVTDSSIASQTVITQPGQSSRLSGKHTGTVMTQGSLNMAYSQMVPIGITDTAITPTNPDDLNPGDSVILKDDD